MNKFFKSMQLSFVMLLFTSCATIMNGTTQKMGISSSPSSAAIWINGNYIGETPLCADLKRNQSHQIRIELDGYQPYEIICTKQLSCWVFGNVVFGGLVGICVDAVSGGIYRLTPEQVNANLHQNDIAFSKRDNNSYIAVIMQPDPSWEKIGQLAKVTH